MYQKYSVLKKSRMFMEVAIIPVRHLSFASYPRVGFDSITWVLMITMSIRTTRTAQKTAIALLQKPFVLDE